MEKIIKVVLCCIITTILVLCVWIFWDFCKFNQVNSDIEDLREKEINPIYHWKWVFNCYPKTLFLYKGRTFENIPCHEYKDKTKKYMVNIQFNWNNTITYSINNKERILNVDSINITTSAYMPIDTIDWICASEDSVFYMISFYDKKKNMIEISRQKSSLPYGGKRHGFNIMIDKMDLVTHNTSPFDY